MTHQTTTEARVVRLAPWLLEVVRECPDKPWDAAVSTHGKRRDAEIAAREADNAR